MALNPCHMMLTSRVGKKVKQKDEQRVKHELNTLVGGQLQTKKTKKPWKRLFFQHKALVQDCSPSITIKQHISNPEIP